eukprot:TRINITY_DN297_c0_g1_i14.p1 TRINITY_DN297_c0_g1~~TRINITY_DN297_c0_g1_i14.p1  ORF type:complete len:783 (-),score=46.36 TRINITY_DN297_c0_g1_i14:1141-3489(-)
MSTITIIRVIALATQIPAMFRCLAQYFQGTGGIDLPRERNLGIFIQLQESQLLSFSSFFKCMLVNNCAVMIQIANSPYVFVITYIIYLNTDEYWNQVRSLPPVSFPYCQRVLHACLAPRVSSVVSGHFRSYGVSLLFAFKALSTSPRDIAVRRYTYKAGTLIQTTVLDDYRRLACIYHCPCSWRQQTPTKLTKIETIFKNTMKKAMGRAENEPTHAAIYTFLSAAPTMTNSRVEALGTGSQPPYIKIAKGFGRDFITDDNIISQVNKGGYKLGIVGDSLWSDMYPKELYSFVETSSSYSQETVDHYVQETMKHKLEEPSWNFLITHVNGLDHAGHHAGYYSEEVLEILLRNDELLDDYSRRMNNDTLLVAFGDHGVIPEEGLHGGGSKLEIEAGLFAYTKKGFNFRNFANPETLPEKTKYLVRRIVEKIKDMPGFLNRGAFSQLDIVPTTAAIFNVPIPFKSIGVIIPELLHYDVKSTRFVSESLYELLMDHIINFLQVYHYYEFAYTNYGEMEKQWLEFDSACKEIKRELPKLLERLKEAMRVEDGYVGNDLVSEILEEEWTEYENTIEKTMNIIKMIRERLEKQREDFINQWCAVKGFYLYSSWFMRVLVTVSLALTIFIIGFIIHQAQYQALSEYTPYGIALIVQIGLLALIAFFPALDHIAVPLVFTLGFYIICAQAWIIYKYFSNAKAFIRSANKFSIIAVVVLYAYHSLGCTMITINDPCIFIHLHSSNSWICAVYGLYSRVCLFDDCNQRKARAWQNCGGGSVGINTSLHGMSQF